MRCAKCMNLFPPGFTEPTEDGKNAKCIFCEREKDPITVVDPRTNKEVTYTKKQVVDEYEKYVKQMAERPDIKSLIVDNIVKDRTRS